MPPCGTPEAQTKMPKQAINGDGALGERVVAWLLPRADRTSAAIASLVISDALAASDDPTAQRQQVTVFAPEAVRVVDVMTAGQALLIKNIGLAALYELPRNPEDRIMIEGVTRELPPPVEEHLPLDLSQTAIAGR